MTIFADRIHAGRDLAASLTERREADAVVFGLPRGGVVVAAEVARAAGWPLDIVVVRKLGALGREEVAVGAIADGVRVVSEAAVRAFGMTAADVERVEARERTELHRRQEAYRSPGIDVRGRVAIVVDDGIATGATALAACRSLRARGPAWIILAAPVAPAGWCPDADAVDEFVCPHVRRDFQAIGQYYDDFPQTTDAEVARLLAADPRA